MKKVDTKDIDKHPLTIATYFHQQFLNVIHPFSDGNGRIGRIYTNLILLKNGYPPVFIKEVNKDEYLKRFDLSDNNMNPMLDFMADRLIASLEEKWEFMKGQKWLLIASCIVGIYSCKMKKAHVELIIIVVAGYLLVNLLDSRQWNILVYSLLLILIIASIVRDVLTVVKTTQGIYADGEVVDMQNAGETNKDNEKILIEFISPVDNLRYQIKSGKRFLDKQMERKKIKVWINKRNPEKSLVVKELDGEFAVDLVGRLFFLVVVVLLLVLS